MNNNKVITLIDEVSGESFEVLVVCSFLYNDVNYLIYSKNEVDYNDDDIVYLCRVERLDRNYVVNLSGEEQKEIIDIIKRMLLYSNICDVFNLSDKENYRERLEELYSEFMEIVPIDVESEVYYDIYEEFGLSLNNDGEFLKQVWDCFRLIYNEKSDREDNMEKSFVLDNFDEIFDNLSRKVEDVDKYIDSLNMRKKDLESVSVSVSSDRDLLMQERDAFESYKLKENERLVAKEKELDEKLEKVNNLLKVLDSKVDLLFKDNQLKRFKLLPESFFSSSMRLLRSVFGICVF